MSKKLNTVSFGSELILELLKDEKSLYHTLLVRIKELHASELTNKERR